MADPLETLLRPKEKQKRRKFSSLTESKAERKKKNAEYSRSRITLGNHLAEWERQKALCGLSTDSDFVGHLLRQHMAQCPTYNLVTTSLLKQPDSLELNAAYAQREAARMSNCSSTTSLTEVTTNIKGVLPQGTMNELPALLEVTIEAWAKETNKTQTVPQVTRNEIHSQDEEAKMGKSRILEEQPTSKGPNVAMHLAHGKATYSYLLKAGRLIVGGSHNDVRTKYHWCKSCQRSISDTEINNHQLLHSKGKLDHCAQCVEGFATVELVEEHVLKHMAHEPLHKCGSCTKVFRRRETLKKHELTHVKTSYVCDKCGKEFRMRFFLDKHMHEHTGLWPHNCSQCGKGCHTKTELIRHMEIHSGVPSHVCQTCGKGFVTRKYLLKHRVIHKEDRPFKCTICEKTFKWIQCLRTHEESHTAQRKYECTICGQCFKHRPTMSRHMRKHSGEQNHQCSTCGKRFFSRSEVGRHMLIHSKERPHQCEVCGDAFQQKGHLVTHMMRHTGEWSHKCSLCGKGFGNPGHLSKHMGTKHGST